ncbi:MAG: hypothetical protein KDA75_21095, partial [Planctomycetaceae bacterium]|nr:hypothetical protein [Planctomycetaceae bacterium]
DLLEHRDRSRSRRPLVALGFLGPILFLFAMYWIAESAVPRIVAAAEQNLIDRALGSDGVSARLLAESVHQELHSRQAVLERIADVPMLRDLIHQSRELTDEQLLQCCSGVVSDAPQAAGAYDWMRQVVANEQQRLTSDGRTTDDSWFVTDARGRQVFRSPPQEGDRQTTLGRFFHWRDYFHGRDEELPPETPLDSISIRTTPGVSTPFRSQATDQYMVAIAMPVASPEDGRVVGILARTIRLTALLQQWEVRLRDESLESSDISVHTDTQPRFLALADTRGDSMKLLDHPALTSQQLSSLKQEEIDSLLTIASETAESLQTRGQIDHYRDPFSKLSDDYTGEWLAAAAPVGDTGWMTIVQERRDSTIQPVDNLRRVFLRAGVWSIGIFSALLLLLWYLIQRAAN